MGFLKMHYQRFQVLIYRKNKKPKQILIPARSPQDAIENARAYCRESYTKITCDGYDTEY